MKARNQQVIRERLLGLIVAVLVTALAGCSQPGPTDVVAEDSDNCVLIRDQIYCP